MDAVFLLDIKKLQEHQCKTISQMLRILLLAIWFLSMFSMGYSQYVTISGFVVDENSGEALVGANIYDTISQSGSITNQFGFYSLQFEKNTKCHLTFSYVGYKPVMLDITFMIDSLINVMLPISNNLPEVKVYSTSEKYLEERTEIGKLNIPISTLKTLPSITGEPDILRAFQLLAGVQSGSEGNNGLFVRGGTPDQNLYLLDDVVLYNVSHLGGMYSVFDPSMVNKVDLYKGGFPAKYGGRISSVIDVRNKEGNINSLHWEIGLSLFLSKFFVEAPIKKGESSFAFSVRRSNLDIYSFLYNKLNSNDYQQGYSFYDINLKANYKLSQRDRVFISYYHGRDKFVYKENDVPIDISNLEYSSSSELKWGNIAGSVRWLHVFKNGIFNNLTIANTDYLYQNQNDFSMTNLLDRSNLDDEYYIRSGVNDLMIKTDTEIPWNKTKLKIGAVYTHHSFIPSYISNSQSFSTPDVDSILIDPSPMKKLIANDLYGYMEFHFNIKEKLSGNTGFRAGYYSVESETFPSFEPRIILNYLFLPSFSFKASFCSMRQNTHLLTNSNTGLPSDIWIPSTSRIAPESSQQISVGFAHTSNKMWEYSLEAYVKRVSDLIEYKEGTLIFSGSLDWEDKIEVDGEGEMRGIELMINKKKGELTGWVAYTISKNSRTFRNLNQGKEFPFMYDQRHNFSLVFNYRVTEKLSLSTTWIYNSGNNITLPEAKYQILNSKYSGSGNDDEIIYSDVHIYSDRNGYKMPDYHRLDFGLNYSVVKARGISRWTIGVYNVYNRQNAYYLFFKIDNKGETKLYQQSLFPILLNFGYSFSFST